MNKENKKEFINRKPKECTRHNLGNENDLEMEVLCQDQINHMLEEINYLHNFIEDLYFLVGRLEDRLGITSEEDCTEDSLDSEKS